MTIGGYNVDKHLEAGAHKIKKSSWNDQYKVDLKDIQISEESIGAPESELKTKGGPFFDSGTTLTYFPRALKNSMTDAISSFCDADKVNRCGGLGYKKCYNFAPTKENPTPESFFDSFPPVSFLFDDGLGGLSNYTWYANDYYFLDKEYSTYQSWCLSVEEYSGGIILGGTFMRNYDILFNKTGEFIGFARAVCSPGETVDMMTGGQLLLDGINDTIGGGLNYTQPEEPNNEEPNKQNQTSKTNNTHNIPSIGKNTSYPNNPNKSKPSNEEENGESYDPLFIFQIIFSNTFFIFFINKIQLSLEFSHWPLFFIW